MSLLRIAPIGLSAAILLIASARAAEPPATGPTTTPSKPAIPKNAKGEPEVGPVRSARSLLGARVMDASGGVMGKVENIALDVGKGEVQAVFVMPNRSTEAPRESLAIPVKMLEVPDEGPLVLGSAFEEKPKTELGNPDDKSLVVLLSAVNKFPVHNGRGEEIGHLDDFAIAPTSGKIAYAVMVAKAKSSDTLYPIPLTAFVVKDGAPAWILELPEETVLNTPTFHHTEWPTAISLAWSEYVHVRYGRSPFGGVTRQLHQAKK